ncbi:hypothetical protein PMKS-002031 [Pichia membranifaciens]|uniref:Uncharacterized protein n=1 Tax=Pichia membranifaciens TaxID=4926 RepID=A0A1Q2YG67_9ASCO|nr:hypothetical protein PMKS-002031 [Pichia membranifaciens]
MRTNCVGLTDPFQGVEVIVGQLKVKDLERLFHPFEIGRRCDWDHTGLVDPSQGNDVRADVVLLGHIADDGLQGMVFVIDPRVQDRGPPHSTARAAATPRGSTDPRGLSGKTGRGLETGRSTPSGTF